MASLKRFKQPSENCSNRSQDIPPRFKRQKSLTSPKHQTGMVSGSLNSHQKESSFPREGRKIVKKNSPQKAQLNVERAATKFQSQPYVLSPMENKLFNLTRNDENSENVNLANCVDHNSLSVDNILGLSTISSINRHSPSLNTDTLPQKLHGWYETGSASNNQCNSLQEFSQSQNMNDSTSMMREPEVDYSDPDIRTIEMLRELERVADQTDVGNEENTNDKNSLVSHHLRMLMCAVDKYTQGVDDEGSDSQSNLGESLPQEKPKSLNPSPVPSKNPGLYEHQIVPQIYGSTVTSDYSFEHDFGHCPPNIVLNNPVLNSHSSFSQERKLNTWNPWTTPSFNALDVYACPPNVQASAPVVDHSHVLFFDPSNSFYLRDACY